MAIAAASLIACGTRTPLTSAGQLAIPDLQGITESIANTAHYPAKAIEITSSASRFRISIRDASLAVADGNAHNAAAATLVAASEQVLAAHPEFSALEAISVAIIHGDVATDGTAGKNWHIEDVIEFRRGPSGRFSVHIT